VTIAKSQRELMQSAKFRWRWFIFGHIIAVITEDENSVMVQAKVTHGRKAVP